MSITYKQYMVDMEFDKFEGSIRRDTKTDWYYAYSKKEAEELATSEYGHLPNFEIKSCY